MLAKFRGSSRLINTVLAISIALPFVPQTIAQYGRGDDWVGRFLLLQQPNWWERVLFLSNAQWIAGRYLNAILSASLVSTIALDLRGFFFFRSLNVGLIILISLSLVHFLRIYGYPTVARAAIGMLATTLPGMYFWTSQIGSTAYLGGALAALWAGFLSQRIGNRPSLFSSIFLALVSVYIYQPSVALVMLAPAIGRFAEDRFSKTSLAGSLRRFGMAPLIYCGVLGLNYLTVRLYGFTDRLIKPTVSEIVWRLWDDLFPKTILPWASIMNHFNNEAKLASVVLICFFVVLLPRSSIWQSNRDSKELNWSGISKTLTPVLSFLLSVVPLAMTQPIKGTRTTVFASTIFWSLLLCALCRSNWLAYQRRVFATGLLLVIWATSIGVSQLYFRTTVLPASREFRCSLLASRKHEFPKSLPMILDFQKNNLIQVNEEWILTSLEEANPARFQTLASYELQGIDPRLTVSIWAVPSPPNKEEHPTDWQQSFLRCMES